MNERITFISIFDDINIERIEYYIKQINEKLCKVPFGKNVDNRIEVDTLPYHFTLSAWNIEDKEKVKNTLSQIEFPKLKLFINDVEIMGYNCGHYGNRVDILCDTVDRILNRNKKIKGIGDIHPAPRGFCTIYSPNNKYYGKCLKYIISNLHEAEDNCENY